MGKIPALSPQNRRRIETSFAAQSMMHTLGAQLTSVQHGSVAITAPLLSGSLQQHGFAHAGLTFAIGDSAAGYAALSVMPDGYEVLTSEMKVHLLAPGRGQNLIARGRVVKPGRRLVIVQADVFAIEGGTETHIALMTGTMVPVAVR